MKTLLAIALLLGALPQASAQSFRGLVVDSASGRPLPGVAATLRDRLGAVVTTQQSTEQGTVVFASQPSGWYEVQLRRLGYRPFNSGPVYLESGQPLALRVALLAAPAMLDTVEIRASARLSSTDTPGREFFRRHLAENKGIFVSGVEIVKSGRTVTEYLATVPGLALTTRRPPSVASLRSYQPDVPGANGKRLTASRGNKCLYGRIDRWSIPQLMLMYEAIDIDEILEPEHVRGIEVYGDVREVPGEWQDDMWVSSRVYVDDPYFLVLGHLGNPMMHLPSSRVPPVGGHGSKIQGVFLGEASVWQGRNASAPRCAFIQIWTRVAW